MWHDPKPHALVVAFCGVLTFEHFSFVIAEKTMEQESELATTRAVVESARHFHPIHRQTNRLHLDPLYSSRRFLDH